MFPFYLVYLLVTIAEKLAAAALLPAVGDGCVSLSELLPSCPFTSRSVLIELAFGCAFGKNTYYRFGYLASAFNLTHTDEANST